MIARAPAQALAIVGLGVGVAFVHWAQEPTVRLSAFGSDAPAPPPPDTLPPEPRTPAAPETSEPEQAPPVDPQRDASAAPATQGDLASPPTTGGPYIGTDAAVALWGDAIFVDAREPREYLEGHIAGAVMIPASSRDRAVRLADYGLDTPVVIYCGGGECDASELIAITLQNLGFTDIRVYKDGYPAWVAGGHPVETGEDTLLGPE